MLGCLLTLTANAQLQMVTDIYPGTAGSSPNELTAMNGKIYFSASKPDSLLPGTGNTENELWTSDGNASGTYKVIDLLPGSQQGTLSPTQLTRIGNTLFFTGFTNLYGRELWVSDGTTAGTHMVKNLYPYGESAFSSTSLFPFNGKVAFIARDSAGYGLFISDGTDAGTLKLIGVGLGSGYVNYGVLNNQLYVHTGTSSNKYQLIKTDGTIAGTSVVVQTDAYFTTNMVALNNAIYFIGDMNGYNFELWKTDGTAGGTVLVKEIKSGSGACSDVLASMMAAGNTLYFFADDGTSGRELWKSDGTAGGTVLLKDFTAGANGTTFTYGPLLAINNRVLFSVQDPSGYPSNLWSSDGTASGTIQIADTCMGAYIYGRNFDYTGNKVLIADGDKIIATDGTTAGTEVVVRRPPGNGYFNQLVYTNERIYCSAYDTATGEELWTMPYQGGTVGLKKITQQANVHIYPNPCSDVLTFDLGENPVSELEMYDFSAKSVFRKSNPGSTFQLNTADWKKGMYIYQLRLMDGTLQTGKIILD